MGVVQEALAEVKVSLVNHLRCSQAVALSAAKAPIARGRGSSLCLYEAVSINLPTNNAPINGKSALTFTCNSIG